MRGGAGIVRWDPCEEVPAARMLVADCGGAELGRARPDACWVALDGDGMVVGRCGVWWRGLPELAGGRVGYIGHWAAVEGDEVAGGLLAAACGELRAAGCGVAVGPVDGSTWRRYRFVTGTSGAAPFFMEPVNPLEYPRQFRAYGFGTFGVYHSVSDERLGEEDEKTAGAARRLEGMGVRLRVLDAGRVEEEMREIHGVVRRAFRRAPLYQELPFEEFAGEYEKVRRHVGADWVTVAEEGGRVVGFAFAVPDLLQARDGGRIDQAILKTLAVLPGREYAGLGLVLTGAARARARAAGCRRLIHALMHEANVSRRIRAGYVEPMRRYEVYSMLL